MLGLEGEENIFLAEESFEDLIYLPVTSEILECGLDHEGCIEIEGKALVFRLTEPTEFWLVLTDRYAKDKVLQERFIRGDELPAERKKVRATEDGFLEALTEYYSHSLADELLCESCNIPGLAPYVDDRIERLKSFLEPLVPNEGSVLEIGCGSGMATQALKYLGHEPWCIDYDRCDVCQALKASLLDHRRTLVLDARLLGRFFEPASFDMIIGFMVGLIDRSNWPLWRDILHTSASLSRNRVLFTTYTQKEADLIAKSLGDAGWMGDVIDNSDCKGIYDQWAYLASREL